MQIYNEGISDLLKEDRYNLSIREDARKGVYVHRLSEWVVRSPIQVYELMAKGAQMVVVSRRLPHGEMFFTVENDRHNQHERSEQSQSCYSEAHCGEIHHCLYGLDGS